MNMALKNIVLTMILFTGRGAAEAQTTINASGDGWCTISACNNINPAGLKNTYANEAVGFRNWFSFAVAAPISSAVLSIWQVDSSTGSGDALYILHAADAIDFNHLASGTALGSISYADTWNGAAHYVDINLGPAGTAYINSHVGSTILFGGATQGDYAEFFGGTRGTPVARLTVNAVPEPGSYAMLSGGMILLALAVRFKRGRNRSGPDAQSNSIQFN